MARTGLPARALRVLVVGTLLVAMAGQVAPAVAEQPPARLASPEIFGYIPYWDLDAQIDYGAITTIAYFGLPADAEGHLVRARSSGRPTTEYARWTGSKVQTIIENAHAQGVKVVLTVSRFAWSTEGMATTTALLSDPAARTTLVGEIVDEIGSRGVDGVNLDFEPILASQRDNYASFVRELRTAFDGLDPDLQLTFAATAFEGHQTYAMIGELTAEGAADAVIIMAYPSRIDGRAGGMSPMDSATTYHLTEYVNDYLEHVAPQAIVLALPWYGRQWPTKTKYRHSLVRTNTAAFGSASNVVYANAVATAVAHGRRYDPVEHSAWTRFRWKACSACRTTWKQLYYDDVESLDVKYDWAGRKGLRGIGIWALGYDNAQPELWKLLRVKYRGLVDNDPPTGTFRPVAASSQCGSGKTRLVFDLDDGGDGSGAVYIKISDRGATRRGVLRYGQTYPAASELCWPSTATRIHAQWRDVAGNWSSVQTIER